MRVAERIAEVPADTWNALNGDDNPFVRHEFLSALEDSASVAPDTGWQPLHLLLEDQDGRLLGAAPLYAKYHSWGEFVFDFGWADASRQLGDDYYPKLVATVPFVPSTGPRLLAASHEARLALVDGMRRLVDDNRLSSAHVLFADAASDAALDGARWLARDDVQFQWHNPGYADFGAFVATLTSEKRKKLLRERRRIAEAGIRFEVRHGDTLDEAEWAEVYALYANTYEERGQPPYLTPAFFQGYGARRGSPLRVIMGYEASRLVCMALTVRGPDTLFGRHWGAAAHYNGLHFECCYYQGMELCIREGLARYDAGTQGAHKLARGFTPVTTRSRHHLRNARLRAAVENFLQIERMETARRREALDARAPFRSDRV